MLAPQPCNAESLFNSLSVGVREIAHRDKRLSPLNDLPRGGQRSVHEPVPRSARHRQRQPYVILLGRADLMERANAGRPVALTQAKSGNDHSLNL